jgi:hypothetical protein
MLQLETESGPHTFVGPPQADAIHSHEVAFAEVVHSTQRGPYSCSKLEWDARSHSAADTQTRESLLQDLSHASPSQLVKAVEMNYS